MLFIKKFLHCCIFCYYSADPANSVICRFLGRKDRLLGRKGCGLVKGRGGTVLLCNRRVGTCRDRRGLRSGIWVDLDLLLRRTFAARCLWGKG
ncbi:hypothetical protein BJX66DRAFT_308238 [Aspergillus keveii]|uniref:Secreted protein n=1 Tax=Aspergillus keveii TaxID=714993 RepID=A0ABR4FZU1_9EURO